MITKLRATFVLSLIAIGIGVTVLTLFFILMMTLGIFVK